MVEPFNFIFSIIGWGIDLITVILNDLPWKWTEIILSFLRLHLSTALWTFVHCESYSISSMGFLPTRVDIMVIWLNLPILVYFSSLILKMSMFTLVISCLTTSNLPWFMDLKFQVLMQYCSLQHQTLLPSLVTSTTGCCFCFGSVSSFFMELFLHCSPVAYWPPTYLGISSFSVLYFCFFILFMGFSKQGYWSGFSFPSPVDHILSELSTMTCLPWVALQGMAHSFTELTRLWSMWWVWLVFCDCGFHSVCPLVDKDKRLMEASWWEGLTVGETGSCSDRWGHVQ